LRYARESSRGRISAVTRAEATLGRAMAQQARNDTFNMWRIVASQIAGENAAQEKKFELVYLTRVQKRSAREPILDRRGLGTAVAAVEAVRQDCPVRAGGLHCPPRISPRTSPSPARRRSPHRSLARLLQLST